MSQARAEVRASGDGFECTSQRGIRAADNVSLEAELNGGGAHTALMAVVVTDLVGSTGILTTLGDLRADDLRRSHDERLAQVIGHHGGRVVKSTGDGVVASFPAASQAVDASIAMQQTIEELGRDFDGLDEIRMRIGVSVGDVTLEGDDMFGLPLVQATRLEAAGEPGWILCTELVRAMAEVRTDAEFESVGGLDLKGMDRPVQAHRIKWTPRPSRQRAPLPAALRSRVDSPLVGRASELARLQDGLSPHDNRTEFILVSGEPGVGKTRLCIEALSAVHGEGAVVLAGSCIEAQLPLGPVTGALTSWASTVDDDVLTGALGHDGAIVGSFVPVIARRMGMTGSFMLGEDPVPILAAVEAVVRRIGDSAPVVLFVDDLQWADALSVRVVEHLWVTGAVSSVLATCRAVDLPGDAPFSKLVAATSRVASLHVRLDGLSEGAIGELVAAFNLDPRVVPKVVSATDGNPLFVEELLLSWRQTPLDGNAYVVPQGVRAVLRERVENLGSGGADALRAAAVVGTEFDISTVEEVASIGREQLIDYLDLALRHQLVDEVDAETMRFVHAIVRDAIYEDISAVRRATLHRRAAESLERRAGHDERMFAAIMQHYSEASGSDAHDRSIEAALRAGDAACAVLAYDSAIAYFGSARDDAVRHVDGLLGLAEVQRRRGGWAEAADLFRDAYVEAELRRQPDRMARAAYGVAGYFPGSVIIPEDEARAMLEAALAGLEREDTHDRARSLAALSFLTKDRVQGMQICQQAMEMARRIDDLSALAYAQHARHALLMEEGPKSLEEAVRLAPHMRRVDELAGEWEIYGTTAWSFIYPFQHLGRFDQVQKEKAWLGDFSRERRWTYGLGIHTLHEAADALERGDTESAENLGRFALSEAGFHRNVQANHLMLSFSLRRAECRTQELIPLLDMVAEMDIPGFFRERVSVYKAYGLDEAGKSSEASALLDEVSLVDSPRERGTTAALAVDLAARVGSPATVSRFREALAPWSGLWQFDLGLLGPVDRLLADLDLRLGNLDQAVEAAATARRTVEKHNLPVQHADAALTYARVAIERGVDPDYAIDEALRRCGALPLERQRRQATELASQTA